MNLMKTSLALILATSASTTMAANSFDSAQSIQSKTNAASASSQKRIDVSAEKTLTLKAEIEQLEEEVKNLKVYRDHLTALVASQDQEVTSLDSQIEEIKSTRQGIVPLMYQMVDGLKQIVAQDAPIKLVQRQERIAKLESMMTRADVSDAEKYRRILEAYQIELDYGTKLGLYQGQISVNDESREADVLYLGRISLVARSLNGSKFWSWDQKSNQWLDVDASLKSELDKAFSIAAKQTAPSLITLPVSLKVAEAK
jgi:chromosome segregation ATPase